MDFLVAHFAELLFYFLAGLTVLFAFGVVFLKNPVHSALSLLATFVMVAMLFIFRHAEFLGAVQLMVYAGGIMVLFLFVIMLARTEGLDPERAFLSNLAPAAVVGGVLLGALVSAGILLGVLAGGGHGDAAALQMVDGVRLGNTEAVSMLLYTKYLIPFEVVSVILLVAMIGAIVFGRKDRFTEAENEEVDS